VRLSAHALICVSAAALACATPPSLAASAAVHHACSAPGSAHRPCHFSTPSGNIRCVWTPSPNQVTCELVSRRRTYRLHPKGRAKAVHVSVEARGETLPTSQQIVFPESLSCRDTRRTMTCNQDFGFGEFRLGPHGSHAH